MILLTELEFDFLSRLARGNCLPRADSKQEKMRQRMRKFGFAELIAGVRRWNITNAGLNALSITAFTNKKVADRLHDEFGGNWRQVVGDESRYYVSDTGQVFSLPRQRTKGGIMNQWERAGYMSVILTFGSDDRKKIMSVHRLVASAFIGDPPPGTEVRHLDGNKKNNNISNIAYGTKAENEADKIIVGTRLRGERTPSAKLSWNQVCFIREKKGLITQRDLATRFGVNRTTIQRIQSGQYWVAKC